MRATPEPRLLNRQKTTSSRLRKIERRLEEETVDAGHNAAKLAGQHARRCRSSPPYPDGPLDCLCSIGRGARCWPFTAAHPACWPQSGRGAAVGQLECWQPESGRFYAGGVARPAAPPKTAIRTRGTGGKRTSPRGESSPTGTFSRAFAVLGGACEA